MTQYQVFLTEKREGAIIKITNTVETVGQALLWLVTNAFHGGRHSETIDFGYKPVEVEDPDFEYDREEHLRQRYGR